MCPEGMRGMVIDIAEPGAAVAAIVDAARNDHCDAVIASDDATVEIAGLAAAALGLRHNPAAALRYARRKALARERLRAAGVPVPDFAVRECVAGASESAAGIGYPCVIKPLAMAASRGVMRCDDAAEFARHARRLAPIVAAEQDREVRAKMLVEAFVPGFEIAIEALLDDGRLKLLAVFDKPDPLDGPFFEETYYISPSRLAPDLLALAASRVQQACRAFGLRFGPVHAELRIDAGEAWLIDFAARTIGGDCARLLRFGTGHGLEELVLRNALGMPAELRAPDGGAGVLMLPIERAGTLRRVEGVVAANAVPGVEEVVIAVREGYELVPLPEGGSYLGFVFARAADAAGAERALRAAHRELKVVVAPAWRIAVA